MNNPCPSELPKPFFVSAFVWVKDAKKNHPLIHFWIIRFIVTGFAFLLLGGLRELCIKHYGLQDWIDNTWMELLYLLNAVLLIKSRRICIDTIDKNKNKPLKLFLCRIYKVALTIAIVINITIVLFALIAEITDHTLYQSYAV